VARYKDFRARVPRGLYYEPADSIASWGDGCSSSLDETVGKASPAGTVTGKFTTEWFYEAASCDGGVRKLYRQIRCDYFDGKKLTPPSIENLEFLGSLLWWIGGYNVAGSALLGYEPAIGDATDRVEVCTISTVHGDFGLCDQITLESTTHLLIEPGNVTLGKPTRVKTIQGDCH